MEDKMSTLKAGKTVQLKSGGPGMTVEKIWDNEGVNYAKCQWFEENTGSLKHGDFPLNSLNEYNSNTNVMGVIISDDFDPLV
jgi:uncharacterized protein YodC (DUF2158 family)